MWLSYVLRCGTGGFHSFLLAHLADVAASNHSARVPTPRANLAVCSDSMVLFREYEGTATSSEWWQYFEPAPKPAPSDRGGLGEVAKPLGELERATGVEPATSSLGSWHSTTELRPPVSKSRVAAPTCQIHGPQYCTQHGPRYKPRVVARTHREPAPRQARIVAVNRKLTGGRVQRVKDASADDTPRNRVSRRNRITRKEAYQ